jgi:hypothetical protein
MFMRKTIDVMREAFERDKNFPAAIHCAEEMGLCTSRPIGYNVVNPDTDIAFTTWACEWHIRPDGVWLVEKEIVIG